MFTKNVVSQSMIDAVNAVIGETPKKPETPKVLKEEIYSFNIDPNTGQMKDEVEVLISGDNTKLTKKQIVMIEEGKKKMLSDADMDETGFHKAAHAAKKAGQNQFEFMGKKYPVTAKSHTEEYELDEEGNCVTPPQAKDIAKKEVKGHEKKMHHKEGVSFKDRLLEVYMDKKDKGDILDIHEKEMTTAQKAKREKIVMSMKDKESGFKKKYGKRWKDVMYATATKQAMKEETEEVDEGVMDTMKKVGSKVLKTLGHGSDADMRKDLQKKMGMKQTGEKPMKKEEIEGVEEGWDDMMKAVKDRAGPQPSGGSGMKQGHRYGGSKQKEKPEHDEPEDKKVKKEGVDPKVKTVDMLRGRVKMPKDFQDGNEHKSAKIKLSAEEMHPDEKEDKKLIKKMVDKSCLKKEGNEYYEVDLVENTYHTHTVHFKNDQDEWMGKLLLVAKDDDDAKLQAIHAAQHSPFAGLKIKKVTRKHVIMDESVDETFKGPEAGSGTGDNPFITSESKPLKNAKELASTTMKRIKMEMLGKISN